MISIRDALVAAGRGFAAEELSRLEKYELIDSDGTSLGWKTWEEIARDYSLDARVADHKTSSLPWDAVEPQDGTRVVKLRNITARDIVHLSSSETSLDFPSNSSAGDTEAKPKTIPKRWKAFAPFDVTYSLYDVNGQYIGERTMLQILTAYDLKWTFYLDGVRIGRPAKDKKAPPLDEAARRKLIEDGRRRRGRGELHLIEYVAPVPPKNQKASKRGKPEEKVEVQSTTKSVPSQNGVPEEGVGNVPDMSRRPSLLERCLSPYSDDVQGYVKEMLSRPDVDVIVNREVSRHPDRYVAIKPYQNVLRRVTALANTYLHRDEDEIEDLMDRAHLFVFDDDAWWVARNCVEPLTRLPYAVCIVEDVAFYDEEGTIRARALSNRADVDEARRLLSFVANSCGKVEVDDFSDFIAMESAETTKHGDDSSVISPSKRGRSGSPVSRISLAGTHVHGVRAHGHHGSPAVHYRRGHWRNQACGHGLKQHKRIWISETIVTPSGAPFKIGNPKRVHRVSCHDAGEYTTEP